MTIHISVGGFLNPSSQVPNNIYIPSYLPSHGFKIHFSSRTLHISIIFLPHIRETKLKMDKTRDLFYGNQTVSKTPLSLEIESKHNII